MFVQTLSRPAQRLLAQLGRQRWMADFDLTKEAWGTLTGMLMDAS